MHHYIHHIYLNVTQPPRIIPFFFFPKAFLLRSTAYS